VRREPSLAFEGALRILGHHESRLIGKLDIALGGVIMASGAGIAAAAIGGPALAPAAMFAAAWGLADQKSEAVSLLGKAIGAISGKLSGTRGYERRQLIAAAHTTIVVAAFFESFQEHAGKELPRLKITDAEKEALLAPPRKAGEKLYDILYAAEVPAPSAAYGFEENVVRVEEWYAVFTQVQEYYLHGLSATESVRIDWEPVIDGAVERYRSHFLALAAKVPEFMIWALLGEGAATRAQVAELRADIAAALDAQRDALGRVASLLALDASPDGPMPDLRAAVARANGGVLEQQIIPEGGQEYGLDITFPATGDIYISPRYRLALPHDRRPADDDYWGARPSRDDFDLMLAGYVTSPDATRLPLLLLGHPGAGKSLLTKILAARLPDSAYTVVRVPLRRVGANAPVLDQIEDPDIEEWLARWRRANEVAIAAGKIRELTADCVTGDADTESRPARDTGQLSGGVRELARQPLLLLMLAIYAADPELPRLSADMATADLYRRLLENFARREAAKEADRDLRADELDDRVRDHLDRLEVAALAMFNRGRQDIGEEELSADLAALAPDARPDGRSRPGEAGQRVIGEFFFVHAAEARPLTGPDEPRPGRDGRVLPREAARRSYEFLHATFGEYLVASRVISELADVADRAFSGRRGRVDPNDDQLYALISHQPLAARKSTLTFAREIFDGMLRDEQELSRQLLEVLEVLLGEYRHRNDSGRYAGYRPLPQDRLRELACYSANLVTLRVMLEPDENSIPLTLLLRVQEDPLEQWRSAVRLWHAGLDADGLQSVLALLELSGNPPGIAVQDGDTFLVIFPGVRAARPGGTAFDLARLTGDQAMEIRLTYGSAIADNYFHHPSDPGDWMHSIASWLIPAIAGKDVPPIRYLLPEDIPDQDIRIIADLIFSYLRIARGVRTRDIAVLQLLFKLPQVFQFDHEILAAVAISDPDLLDDIPGLRNPEIYGRFADYLGEFFPEASQGAPSDDDFIRGRDLLEQLSVTRDPWDFDDQGP
jgi:NACHT conflict system protein